MNEYTINPEENYTVDLEEANNKKVSHMKHDLDVVNYCIDNRVSFLEGYQILIEAKLEKLETEISSFKTEVKAAHVHIARQTPMGLLKGLS